MPRYLVISFPSLFCSFILASSLSLLDLSPCKVICKITGDLEDRILETAEEISGPVDKAKARARKQRELEKSKKALESAASTVRIGAKVAAAQRLKELKRLQML
ncbi:unnamed protein product [Microthlaspi erraticum]|uniref:Uncharacterized protein n=1 Tax=Microthlaspi erraticum TaxID=1685480 RepID=A0A6D2ID28_9BRAS|nr:unnamed protein product [Microthlaspi erraticum]